MGVHTAWTVAETNLAVIAGRPTFITKSLTCLTDCLKPLFRCFDLSSERSYQPDSLLRTRRGILQVNLSII